ncbi:hypothetical protein C8A05DRAFT_19327 [Staphylotrichum tortipilum]|uniref:DUS-like FMN-binding domain-containing protein n=1 Tax=Staphylotrichum tortipilum TaxID=2831512 RepID=A0AAN6MDN2_9PEZI|nr:hypothetical protein C8A05DRAFT_19327 [Staphylotrichum longicolle]
MATAQEATAAATASVPTTATPNSTTITTPSPDAPRPRVPIPPRGVDYRGKIVLAPMVRSGELPSRLLALHYGADLVWGPETVDRALIGATRRVNPRTNMIEYTRMPTHSNSPSSIYGGHESVVYRLDPAFERNKLIFQLGTSDPDRAVAAARFVAPDVAGIDVNAGCPKPFSISGGMGAALLQTPEKLASILEALVRDITPAFGVGISVKIRLLETAAETEALVRRLVATGITGLTIHCRTTPMRPRERAIRGQLRMIADVCREAGVACLMNGDVETRDQAEALVAEFGVDGAMIATAAEKNPSCFRAGADGGMASWEEAVEEYLRAAIRCENKIGNTKYLLQQMVPGKTVIYKEMHKTRSYSDLAQMLGAESLVEPARELDRILGLGEFEKKPEPKKKEKQKQAAKRNAGGEQASKKRKREGEEREKAGKRAVATEAVEVAPAPAAASVAVYSDTLGGSTSAPRSLRRWKSTSAMAVFSGSSQQHLAAAPGQELFAQPGEPALPERLRPRQIEEDAARERIREGRRTDANSVTTAPPSECPTINTGGRAGQCIASRVRARTASRSRARVGKVRSSPSAFSSPASSPPAAPAAAEEAEERVVVVNPCPLASTANTPAPGNRFLISAASTANDKPEDPAPWCMTKSGPPEGLPGAAGAGEVR